MLKNQARKNEKLEGLQGQLGEMHNDFEDMKRTREEARKQLEAKFMDIYKKIQSLKEALDAEAKRVNDSLRAFESKFTFLLNELKDSVYKDINEEKKFMRETIKAHETRMDKLEQMIKEEKEERLKQTDEMLEPLRKGISSLEEKAKKEKEERESGEKEILRNINDHVYEINEKLRRENDERTTKMESPPRI